MIDRSINRLTDDEGNPLVYSYKFQPDLRYPSLTKDAMLCGSRMAVHTSHGWLLYERSNFAGKSLCEGEAATWVSEGCE